MFKPWHMGPGVLKHWGTGARADFWYLTETLHLG